MTRYYLGVPVVPVRPGWNGWIWCQWPDGRVFKHWAEQLTDTPFNEGGS